MRKGGAVIAMQYFGMYAYDGNAVPQRPGKLSFLGIHVGLIAWGHGHDRQLRSSGDGRRNRP